MKISNDRAQVIRWYYGMKDTCNDHFLPLLFDKHRFLVLMGGGGSGKSIFAGRKVLERCATEEGHRFLVLRKVEKTIKESCYRQLVGQAQAFYPEKILGIYKSPMRIVFKNGSEILFSGLDNVEKLKSIFHITSIWIEEASELEEADLNQMDIRLRDETKYYKQIMITFNPISVTHWLKKRFFDSTDEWARTDRSTYKDNRFLPQESIETLLRFRQSDPYYFMVYALGEWGITGKTVFNREMIAKQLEKKLRPLAKGNFTYEYDGTGITKVKFSECQNGMVSVFQLPQEGKPYVIGADTAGEGSDWNVAKVIDNTTGQEAAILRIQTDEYLFVRMLYCLGMWYNEALIGIEVNFSSYPVREMERLNYHNQYVRETFDDYLHENRKAFGFRTDIKSRPVIIANLIQEFQENPDCVMDEVTLEEMSTFVRNETTMRAEAQPGTHDDCVMASAIAQFIRPQQSYLAKRKEEQKKWTADMWEDWENASAAERQELKKIYGEPNI